MALDADYLVDRRRLKRRLTFWRTLAVVAVVAAIAAAVGRFGGEVGGDYIARLDVDGVIVRDEQRLDAIRALGNDSSVRAVVVHINSPGGTVTGGETLYRALIDLGRKKPVVAVMDGLATSAAYMTAIATDRIFAHESTLTGSIGVIMQTADVSRLLDMIGVKAHAFKSGPLKAEPNPLEPLTPEAAQATQKLIDQMYAMFRDMVLKRRHLTLADSRVFADGRVFTGRDALKAKLIDEIGGEREALAWLVAKRHVPAGLAVHPVEYGRDVGSLIRRLDGLARKTILSERLTLDGLVSVWHPDMH